MNHAENFIEMRRRHICPMRVQNHMITGALGSAQSCGDHVIIVHIVYVEWHNVPAWRSIPRNPVSSSVTSKPVVLLQKINHVGVVVAYAIRIRKANHGGSSQNIGFKPSLRLHNFILQL